MPRYKDDHEVGSRDVRSLRQKAVEYALQAHVGNPVMAADIVRESDVIHQYLLDGTVPEKTA
jgi:hypothetical protein